MTIGRTLAMIAAVTFTMVGAWVSASILAEMRLREAAAAASDRSHPPMDILGLTAEPRNGPGRSFDGF
ncbi:MAG TPA: hypothetical protein VHA77_19125 [Xanthobacteraceae bacterium]|jgi:hypothetical protein|nr:hypothetical protein [Xanthobacteraceae bacterium]